MNVFLHSVTFPYLSLAGAYDPNTHVCKLFANLSYTGIMFRQIMNKKNYNDKAPIICIGFTLLVKFNSELTR